jgi:hypothetical protein
MPCVQTVRRGRPWARAPVRAKSGVRDASSRSRSPGRSATSGSRRPCDRRDSNPHGLPHRILSPARLPVPPRSRGSTKSNAARGSAPLQVVLVPRNLEDVVALGARQVAGKVGDWRARVTRRAHGVACPPFRGHVHRAPGQGHDRPACRLLEDRLDQSPRDAHWLAGDLEDNMVPRELRDPVPGAAPQAAVDVGTQARPCMGRPFEGLHCRGVFGLLPPATFGRRVRRTLSLPPSWWERLVSSRSFRRRDRCCA